MKRIKTTCAIIILLPLLVYFSWYALSGFPSRTPFLFYSPLVPYLNFRMSYIGFVSPLYYSIFSLWLTMVYRSGKRINLIFLSTYLIMMTITGLFSHFFHPLEFRVTQGSGTDIVAFFESIGYLLWLSFGEKTGLKTLALSYPLGFLVGSMSDFEVLGSAGPHYFGGDYFLDGDFLWPFIFLILAIFFYFLHQVSTRHSSRN